MDIIDIGSNSVRLMSGNKKTVITTCLAENMQNGKLNKDSMLRTVQALKTLCDKSQSLPVAFATEAVRKADNNDEFLSLVKQTTGLNVQILSGDEEAEISFLGATMGYYGNGVVIDLGGASCETIWGLSGKILYEHSFPFGCVTLKDNYGDNLIAIERFIEENYTIPEFNTKDYFAVGGTVTSLAAMDLKLRIYDPNKIDGHILYVFDITRLITEIKGGKSFPTLDPKRRATILQGAAALRTIMGKLDIKSIMVREKDNLEGYMIKYNLM